jgi:peptide/nickel transport system substrate-binding protein
MGDPARTGRRRDPPGTLRNQNRPSPPLQGAADVPEESPLPRDVTRNIRGTDRSTHETSGHKERRTMTRNTTIRAMAVVAALGLSLTACSSSHSTPKAASTTSGSGSSAAVGKPLVIEDSPEPSFSENFNPYVSSTDFSGEENANSLIYEPLFQINSLNASEAPIPWLAKSAAWSSDGKTLTLTLQSGAKWSDGKPFTAADVAFTFNLIKQYPAIANGTPIVTSATASDDTTAVLTFATAQAANFVAIDQTLIVPQHIWSALGDPSKAIIKSAQAIGTGPFTVDQFSSQKVTYKANPSYWGTKPAVPEIWFPAIATNDAAQLALASGQIDLTGNNIPQVQSVFVAKDPQHNHLYQSTPPYYPASNTVSLFFNQKSPKAPALTDVKVRQAIAAGVDRQTLANQCETGYEAAATSSGGLIAPVAKSLVPAALASDLKPTTDSATVTSLLKGDGYAMSGGKWTKNGKTIKFSVYDPQNYADYYCAAKDIVSELNALGFDAKQVTGIQDTQWSQDLANGNYDVTVHWGQGATPFLQLQYVLDSSQTAPIGKTAVSDIERYSSPAAQAALTKYEGEPATDTAAQNTDLAALQQIVSTDVPATPLMYGAAWYQYNDADYTGWPTLATPYMNPSPNSQAYEYIVLQLKAVG